jgi:hypothetical protein
VSGDQPGEKETKMVERRMFQILLLLLVGSTSFAQADTIEPVGDGGGVVYSIDLSASYTAHNDLMTSNPAAFGGIVVNDFLGANRFYANGITGQNTVAANVEAGHIWGTAAGHETLTHVATYVTGTGAMGGKDRHATWVGMMIGGRKGGAAQGDYQTGIAGGTDLRSGAIATAWVGNAYALSFNFTGNSFLSTYNSYFGVADVVNSSWGFEDAPGTNFFTIAGDGFARANPLSTLVLSAGNEGPNPNTVGGMGSGYNSVTVGALTNSNLYDTIAPFSSRGPQAYADPVHGVISSVRAVVDITAPGDSLMSAYYGGQTGGNNPALPGSPSGPAGGANWYTWGLAGTSFAAPTVSGGVALLDSASKANGLVANAREARVVKAMLLNSADKTPGWNNGQSLVGGIVTTTQSLDWALGAGRMNLDRAYDQLLQGTRDVPGLGGGNIAPIGWDYGAVTYGGQNDYVISGTVAAGTMMTVTLDWFRNRTIDVNTGLAADLGFANLDLEVWDSAFVTMIAQSRSTYNETEHLYFMIPTDGSYGIRVKYTGQIFGNGVEEPFGLAWTVPEPTTLALLGLGGLALGRFRRSRPTRSPK